MLREALIDAGVVEDAIQVVPTEAESVDAALRMGRSDDLILIFGDALTRTWNQITHFRPHSDSPAPEAPHDEVAAMELPDLPSDDVQLGGKVMRDERGVFLAPELGD